MCIFSAICINHIWHLEHNIVHPLTYAPPRWCKSILTQPHAKGRLLLVSYVYQNWIKMQCVSDYNLLAI